MARRQQVALRVKVQKRRHRRLGAVLVVVAGASAALAVASRADILARTRRAVAPLILVRSTDASGVPEPARGEIARTLEAWVGKPVGPLAVRRMQAKLRERFGYLERLDVSRKPFDRRMVATAVLRKAVARGTDGGWIGRDGTAFTAPAGLYQTDLPVIDAGGVAARASAATFLEELDGRLAPTKLKFEGPEDGWALELADGPRLRWGALKKTAEKLAKLGEALEDARTRFARVESADLRFFDDGRILVQPAGK